MNRKNVIIAAAVIVIIVIVALASWQLLKDDENSSDAAKMAEDLIECYDGNFGNLYVADGATEKNATVMTDNNSSYLPHSRIVYTVSDNVKSEYDSKKTTLSEKGAVMGAQPSVITGINGFDSIYAVKYDVQMGTMTKFSMVYFVAYIGDTLVDCSENALYHSGSLVTSTEVKNLFAAISASVNGTTKDIVKNASDMAKYVDEVYSGGFGDFYVDTGATATSATAMTDTGSSRLSHTTVKYTISDDAASEYTTIKSNLDAKESMMGASPVKVSISGFENITAYKYDVVMGTMSTFTLIYFVAYDGDVLIDGSEGPLYFNGSLASDSDIASVFSTIASSVRI